MNEDNIEIRDSGIAGKGVFAKNLIKKGEVIWVLKGELCNIYEMVRRVDEGIEEGSDPLGVDDEVYLDLDELSRTFNHSCNPCGFIRGKSELVALRDIQKDEEITYDYSTTMNDNRKRIEELGSELWTMECNCGSENCRGIVDQFKTLPEDRKDFYIKNKFAPDFIIRKFIKIIG